LKNGSYSKGIIAEKSWYSIRNNSETGNIDEYALSISEGKVGMTTYISMDSIKDNRGNTITLPINPADIRLLEILVIRMLDRMTVFGLTSKPKESAPEWAKRQVAERLAGRKQ
ncbi:MAG: hypothetical protein NTX57_00285, partial [Armatimonadetes bacterium]|nr:hypothetical protein [Armatimonadota bacterium]